MQTTPFARRLTRCALSALTAAAALASAAVQTQPARDAKAPATLSAPPRAQDAFDAAMQLYERTQWPAAWAALSRLADQGHPDAARIAWQMWRYGPTLYRTEFSATPRQLERWTLIWGCGGDSTSRECELAMKSP
jgi:hypothetical protein